MLKLALQNFICFVTDFYTVYRHLWLCNQNSDSHHSYFENWYLTNVEF